LLTDRPRDASWLSHEERDLLESRIAADEPAGRRAAAQRA
jgi:hypothetical protein